MSGLHTEAHDAAHARITEGTKGRSTTMRPALNGVPVKFVRFTGTGAIVHFVDNTTCFLSMDREGRL